jgi:hypothetical protein
MVIESISSLAPLSALHLVRYSDASILIYFDIHNSPLRVWEYGVCSPSLIAPSIKLVSALVQIPTPFRHPFPFNPTQFVKSYIHAGITPI